NREYKKRRLNEYAGGLSPIRQPELLCFCLTSWVCLPAHCARPVNLPKDSVSWRRQSPSHIATANGSMKQSCIVSRANCYWRQRQIGLSGRQRSVEGLLPEQTHRPLPSPRAALFNPSRLPNSGRQDPLSCVLRSVWPASIKMRKSHGRPGFSLNPSTTAL